MNQNITPVQFERASALAFAFGHEWAGARVYGPRPEWLTVEGSRIESRSLNGSTVEVRCSKCGHCERGRCMGNDALGQAMLRSHEEQCWLDGGGPLNFPQPYTVEGIQAAVEGNPDRNEMGGISSPSWGIPEGRGVFGRPDCLVHSTGTGRVAWAVTPSGVVHVEVSRPGGTVLRFTVRPEQTRRVTPEDGGAARLRHWEAARAVCFAMEYTIVPPLSVAAVWARPGWAEYSGCASAEGPEYEAWCSALAQAERECDEELERFGARRPAYL